MAEKDDEQGWLPPQPPGAQPPPPPPPQPPAAQPPPPPAPQGPQSPAQPPPPPPAYPPPPPAYPPAGFPPPPPAYPPQPGYPPQGWQPLPPQPPNNDAVVGFTCAVIGAALLFFTAGLSSIVSLTLGIVAIPYSRKGRRHVEEGRTRKHKDLANAGYITGIVVIVISILATIAWILIFALVDWDEIDDSGEPDTTPALIGTAVRVAAGFARLLG